MAYSSSSGHGDGQVVVPPQSVESQIALASAAAVLGRPYGGVPGTTDPDLQVEARVTDNFPAVGSGSSIESYAVAACPDNTALVAYSAPDQFVSEIDGEPEYRRYVTAHRIYIDHAHLSSKLRCGGVRRGTLMPGGRDTMVLRADPEVVRAVEAVLASEPSLNAVYVLDGELRGERAVLGTVGDDSLVIPYRDGEQRLTTSERCVRYVALSRDREVPLLRSEVGSVSPLPFLMIGGEPVSLVNPQIAVRPSGSLRGPFDAYVVAEAPVAGVWQLFGCGVRIADRTLADKADESSSSDAMPSASSASSPSTGSSSRSSLSSPSSASSRSSASSSSQEFAPTNCNECPYSYFITVRAITASFQIYTRTLQVNKVLGAESATCRWTGGGGTLRWSEGRWLFSFNDYLEDYVGLNSSVVQVDFRSKLGSPCPEANYAQWNSGRPKVATYEFPLTQTFFIDSITSTGVPTVSSSSSSSSSSQWKLLGTSSSSSSKSSASSPSSESSPSSLSSAGDSPSSASSGSSSTEQRSSESSRGGYDDTPPVEASPWVQLTYRGENRNARLAVDETGTLHLAWQSSRCGPDRVYYGTIGPCSAGLNSEAAVAAADKRARFVYDGGLNPADHAKVFDVQEIDPLDTAQPGGAAWLVSESSPGRVTVGAPTVLVSGDPRSDRMLALTCVNRDADGAEFVPPVHEISFGASFDLTLGISGVTRLTPLDEASLLSAFRATFDATLGSVGGLPLLERYGQQFVLEEPVRAAGDIIPIAGAYLFPQLAATLAAGVTAAGTPPVGTGAGRLNLRSYMLAAVPEKLVFRATNVEPYPAFHDANPSATYHGELVSEHLTGRYRLALVVQRSADRGGVASEVEVVRAMGPWMDVGETHAVAVGSHYRWLPPEEVARVVGTEVAGADPAAVSVQGDVLVAVDGDCVGGRAFFADLTEGPLSFAFGLGVPGGGRFAADEVAAAEVGQFHSGGVSLTFGSVAVGVNPFSHNPDVAHVPHLDRATGEMQRRGPSLPVRRRLGLGEYRYRLDLGLTTDLVTLGQVPVTVGGTAVAPDLALDRCLRPHLVWQGRRDGEGVWRAVYAGTGGPLPFADDVVLTSGPADAMAPRLAIDGEGRRVVVFHRRRGDHYQVFAAAYGQTERCDVGPCLVGEAARAQAEAASAVGPPLADPPSSVSAQATPPLRFEYTNATGATRALHFRLSAYADPTQVSPFRQFYSRDDAAAWRADGFELPAGGVEVAPGETVSVVYQPSESDGLAGGLYWVRIEAHDGTSFEETPEAVVYAAGAATGPRCVVPVTYQNSTGSPQAVHFRLTFCSDPDMENAVFSTDTSSASPAGQPWGRWRNAAAFPLSVAAGQAVTAAFDPEIAPLDGPGGSPLLACGAVYYVRREVKVGSGAFSPLDVTTYLCPCDGVGPAPRQARASRWRCSGQGGDDIPVSASPGDATFPRVAAGDGGLAYIVWEDRRASTTGAAVAAEAFAAAMDLSSGEVFSSAHGGRDLRVSPPSQRRHRPSVLVDGFENPVFAYTDRYDVYRRAVSFAEVAEGGLTQSGQPAYDDATADDVDEECLWLRPVPGTESAVYTDTDGTAVAAVGSMAVRLEVGAPPHARAVRLRNENGLWSEWIAVLPGLPGPRRDADVPSMSSESDPAMGGTMEAFFVGPDRIEVSWLLSPGAGTKTVRAQVLTHAGTTPEFSARILAAYEELRYRVDFYADEARTVRLAEYRGTPVASAKRTATRITTEAVESIASDRSDVSHVYFTVTFNDPAELSRLMSLTDGPGAGGAFTFDVVRRGSDDLFDLPFDSEDRERWEFRGRFPVRVSDGIEAEEGLAVVRVNVPDPRVPPENKAGTVRVDRFNFMSTPLGRYGGMFPDRAFRLDAEDFRSAEIARAATSPITLDRFREVYPTDAACSFLTRSCGTPAQPDDALSSSSRSSVSESDSSATIGGEDPSEFCGTFSWSVPFTAEPGFYLYRPTPATFLRYSPPVSLDLSSPLVGGLRVGNPIDVRGLLFLIPDGTSVGQSWNGVPGSAVSFTFPTGTIFLGQPGPGVVRAASASTRATCAKTFTVSGRSSGHTLAAGAPGTEGQEFLQTSSLGFTVVTDGFVPLPVLRASGMVDGYGRLRAKLVHVVCGEGYVSLPEVTCGGPEIGSRSSDPLEALRSTSSESSVLCHDNAPLWPYASVVDGRNLCGPTDSVVYEMYEVSGTVPPGSGDSSSSSSRAKFSSSSRSSFSSSSSSSSLGQSAGGDFSSGGWSDGFGNPDDHDPSSLGTSGGFSDGISEGDNSSLGNSDGTSEGENSSVAFSNGDGDFSSVGQSDGANNPCNRGWTTTYVALYQCLGDAVALVGFVPYCSGSYASFVVCPSDEDCVRTGLYGFYYGLGESHFGPAVSCCDPSFAYDVPEGAVGSTASCITCRCNQSSGVGIGEEVIDLLGNPSGLIGEVPGQPSAPPPEPVEEVPGDEAAAGGDVSIGE